MATVLNGISVSVQYEHLHIILYYYKPFLPPANEVWGKVIFSEACVKNSVHGGGGWYPSMHCRWYPSMPCRYPVGVSRPTPWGEAEGSGQGGSPGPHPWTATAAGGTHPTGMHSCYRSRSLSV